MNGAMIKLARWQWLILSLVAWLFCTCVLGYGGEKGKQKYGRIIFGGYDIAKRSDICLVFNASMTSGDFFEGLQRKDTTDGSLFYKDSRRVDHFPDEVTFEIRIDAAKCNNGTSGVLLSPDASDIVKSLQFDSAWKEGFNIFPADIISMELLQGRQPSSSNRKTWHCKLRIRSKDIPLTSHLVVTIRSSESETVSRVSVYL
jgi:hypothetical protein